MNNNSSSFLLQLGYSFILTDILSGKGCGVEDRALKDLQGLGAAEKLLIHTEIDRLLDKTVFVGIHLSF